MMFLSPCRWPALRLMRLSWSSSRSTNDSLLKAGTHDRQPRVRQRSTGPTHPRTLRGATDRAPQKRGASPWRRRTDVSCAATVVAGKLNDCSSGFITFVVPSFAGNITQKIVSGWSNLHAPSRCAGAPRRPASGSVLSLCVPSRHAALFDHGESIRCNSSVPSPMTLAFALNQEARHSRDSHHPLPMGVLFVAHRFTLCCGLSSCSPPFGGSDRAFARPTGAFTPELPASWSPFSPSGITTVVSERFHRWDIHQLERQLASLYWFEEP